MSLRSEEEWWWALACDQEALREALEAEGFPPFTFYSRRPDFADAKVDMDEVKEIALRVRYGTYKPKKAEVPKKSSRKKRSRKHE